MTATMANVDAALKNDYQPVIREQLRNKWLLLAQIESNSKDVEGRYAVLSLHTNRSGGVGARAASAALPTADAQEYAEQRVSIIRNYAAIAIDGDLIEASASDKGSFARMLKAEIDGAVTDLKNDVSRQVHNDSTKTIAQCGTTSASTTVTLSSPTKVQMKQFHVGMRVDIGTTADYDTIAADRTISAVDRTNGTITISGAAVTTTTSHYVSRAGSDGNELTGFREMLGASGTYQNVSASTYPEWKATVLDNGGTNRTPTEALFEQLIEDINFESDEDVNLLCTTRGVRRNLAAQYQGQRRYTNTVEVKAGFSAVTVAAGNVEVPLVVDNDHPNNTAYALTTSRIAQHQMGNPWSFMDRDGSTLHLVSGFDKYEAYIYNYHQLTTDRRNAHGILKDLTERDHMALTFTEIASGVHGDQRYWEGEVTFDSSYVTGGEDFPPAQVGMTDVRLVLANTSAGTAVRVARWDDANDKLQVYNGSSGSEIANATDLSASSFYVLVYGH